MSLRRLIKARLRSPIHINAAANDLAGGPAMATPAALSRSMLAADASMNRPRMVSHCGLQVRLGRGGVAYFTKNVTVLFPHLNDLVDRVLDGRLRRHACRTLENQLRRLEHVGGHPREQRRQHLPLRLEVEVER